jgi:hypothetical protein
MGVQGLDGYKIMAGAYVGRVVHHLIPFWQHDLAARVTADDVVAQPEEVLEVFESVFAWQVAKNYKGNGLHIVL